MLLLPVVSAVEWDNYYTMSPDNRTATIRNGLTFGSPIANITRITPQNYDVAPGYNYVLELSVDGFIDYQDFVNSLAFHDKKNAMAHFNRDYDLKKYDGLELVRENTFGCLQEYDYGNGTISCVDYGVNGTKKVYKEKWTKLTPADMKKNEQLIIRVYTDVQSGDSIEWYMNLMGSGKDTGLGTKGIVEWAGWQSSWETNLQNYYQLNEASGNAIDSMGNNDLTASGVVYSAGGKITSAYEFNADDELSGTTVDWSNDYSICMWANTTTTGYDNLIYSTTGVQETRLRIDNTNHLQLSSINGPQLGGNGSTINDGAFHYICMKRQTNVEYLYLDGVELERESTSANRGSLAITVGGVTSETWVGNIDEVAIWTRAISDSEIIALKEHYDSGFGFRETGDNTPTVTLGTPANETAYNTNSISVDFTCKGIDDIKLDNLTFSIWNMSSGALMDSQVNTDGQNDTLETFSYTVMGGTNYTWNCLATDNSSQSASATTNNTIFVYSIPDTAPHINSSTNNPSGNYILSGLTYIFNFTEVYDDNLVENVSLYINGAVNQTNTSQVNNTNYIFSLVLGDGFYTYYGKVTDNASQQSTTATQNFTVDSISPLVNITSPAEGFLVTQYNQSINLNWTATDTNLGSCWYQTSYYVPYGELIQVDNFESNFDDFTNSGCSRVTTWASGGNYSVFCPTTSNSITKSIDIDYYGYILFDMLVGEWTGRYQITNGTTILLDSLAVGTNTDILINMSSISNTGTLLIGPNSCLGTCAYTNVSYIDNVRYYSRGTIITENTTVTCSANHTIINYPTTKPDNLTITFYANDTVGHVSSDNVTIYKSTDAPDVILTSPVTLYTILSEGALIDLNWSITNVTVLDECWYAYNGTNTTVTCEDEYVTFNYSSNVNTITFFANDTLGNINSTTTSWIVLAVIEDIIYETEVIETDTATFILVLNLIENVTSVSGNLVYDGTTYTATPIIGDNRTNLTRVIDVPQVSADENISFYFSFNITIISGSGAITTSTFNQTVKDLFIYNCSSNDTNRVLNYTTRASRTPFSLLNTTLASSWSYYINGGTGNVLIEQSYEDLIEDSSSYTFCLNLNETVIVNNRVDISAIDYQTSTNFLVGDELNKDNITSQTVYLLNSSLADATVLQVYDQSGFPVGNVLINVQYFDIGTNSFITITQALTSSIGSDVVYLNWLDSLYKFVLIKDGEIVDTTLPENIFESPRVFTLTEESVFTFLEFQGIDYNIYYDNATKDFVLTFAKSTGKFVQGCLRVNKKQTSGDLNICDTCTTASSATLLCNIGAYGDGTYVATFYGIGSYQAIDWIIQIIGDNFSKIIFEEIGGKDASFYSFMLGLIVVGVMFVNPIAGIVGILLSIFIGNILGFVIIDYITFIGISIVGGVIAWLIKG